MFRPGSLVQLGLERVEELGCGLQELPDTLRSQVGINQEDQSIVACFNELLFENENPLKHFPFLSLNPIFSQLDLHQLSNLP